MASTLTTTTPPPPYDAEDQSDTTFSTPVFRPTTRRSPSLSSSPSHSSNSSFGSSLSFHDLDNSPFSPTTPLQFSKGVPFSWEQIPGIPKQKISRKNNSSLGQLLPLPPPAGNTIPNSSKKNSFFDEFSPKKCASESFRKDPFFAAFVECSKDDIQQQYDKSFGHGIWKSSSKVPSIRSLSDRFGFISMYSSCKTTCTVSESIVYLPRSRNYRRS
ncbi:PREDICTED: uncharacterized protein LOC109216088 [Nicotiana attenuata]|uniref:Uncharacterized protein n=1 Tax=Nicotiana attenuata TaxID=49451 RepID=A0A1J6KTF2_NICAT|nr:PREDICTED: uncharacterized protein LOC109216088 [Nicotiana attenuata]OIT24975.1 hypothetical protein A4A49_26967 [Nicotiana attenuata]